MVSGVSVVKKCGLFLENSVLVKSNMIQKTLVLGLLFTLIYGCSAEKVPIQIKYSSNQCGFIKPMLVSIKSAPELANLFELAQKRTLSAKTFKIDVNYQKQMLILFAIGEKPSSGYTILLRDEVARLESEQLYLPIDIEQPVEGSLQAQVISSPCQIYVIPKIEFMEILVASRHFR
jgi:hypothetical protein